MKRLNLYIRIWWKLTVSSFMISLTSRFNAGVFFVGKLLRFLFFLLFLITIFTRTETLAGYSSHQMIFFYLSFSLVDTIAQLFFREVYRFRPLIVSGDFDFALVKPMSPLLRALVGGADPLDLGMLPLYIAAVIYTGGRLGDIHGVNVVFYILLFINGLIISTGFHILVLALGILATEVDHAIMIFRDVVSMGRIPTDVYHEPLRSIMTFVIPVGVMMTFPAKALMGLLSPWMTLFSIALGLLFLLLCLKVWHYALTQYSSASS
ncbi:MAG: ABC-2 family transporter protein [Candidatus Gottesmanbacteria bacterium]|nr:ABC-2 family transporter protein [Candidatus Gottesmanbacteria bacterium]